MKNSKLLEQFRSFYFRNYPDDMETQISYFAVFGGLGLDIDTSKPISTLIQEHILNNYHLLRAKIKDITLDDTNSKKLLKALAIGDRRIFSAFNKARLNNGNGGAALNLLQKRGVLQMEYSRERHPRQDNPSGKLKRRESRHRISHKVLFTYPFIRFWFYFIVPHRQSIEEQDFQSVLEDFEKRQNSYTSLVYEELSEVLLNYHLRDAQIISSGSYWDANLEIDLLTITDNGNIYVGECKWTNHKVNKKELNKVKEKCERLEITPTQIVLFSKRGFSKELLSMQSKDLALYSDEEFFALVKSSSKPQTQPKSILANYS